MNISSNIFYRITNEALGTSFSLDAAGSGGEIPNGLVDITPSGLSFGQAWQLLSPNQADEGPYYISSLFLGPQKKLDVNMGNETTWVPCVKNLTAAYDQTWNITAHNQNSTGINGTRYSLTPNIFAGSKALSVKNDTNQPVLDDVGGGNQLWELTPVMQINDAAFSTSALWAMATQFTAATSALFPTSMPRPISAFTSPAAEQKGQYTIPKPALIAMIAAPITLILAIIMLSCMFVIWRRWTHYEKQATLIDQKLENMWTRNSSLEIYHGSMLPFAAAGTRIYTPTIVSIASSGELGRSTPEDFNSVTLHPRPPSRSTSRIPGCVEQQIFDASKLRTSSRDDEEQSPVPLILLAEMASGSRRASAIEVGDVSPRSAFSSSEGNEVEREPRPPSSRSTRQHLSLISRWQL